ncbi:ABC transporter ATP-binding protein [Paenibacillus aurantiacus]|uniref:ABC transporter ATP-binding protein n=1 Tax=Paenibacillus aurantiacus TaxID=1936118 RepID=A0ABV5KHB1_9BACL
MLVEVQSVSKSYAAAGKGRIETLEGVDLQVHEREFVCLLGPSGCGKSTLLKLIAGIEQPSAGSIRFGGSPVRTPSPARGVIFQDYALFPWLTVRDNIRFGLRMQGGSRQQQRAMTEEALERFDLQGAGELYPNQISGGMRQRAAIARALCLKPALLLMDEPFAALDALLRLRLQEELVRIWQRESSTFVCVTHDVEEALILADRIVILTPRPGSIKTIVPVELPRPRDRASGAFVQLRERVLACLQEERAEAWQA